MKRALPLAAAAGLAAAAALSALALTRPDPNAQAQLDGCKRDSAAIFKGEAPNWVYVNDKDAPADGPPPPSQWVSGTADAAFEPELAAHPSPIDDPLTHLSYDFNVNVLVDPQYSFLLGGDEAARTGNFEGAGEAAGRLHTEWETGVLPTFAWPEKGDRVTELGSWVWDCGHWDPGGERTELHPYRALWVQRSPSPRSPSGEAEGDLFISTDETPAGIEADCAHKTKGSPEFKACLHAAPKWQDVNGSYRFVLPATRKPAPGARLVYRIVDAGSSPGAPKVSVSARGNGVAIAVDVAAPAGAQVAIAKQVFVGWSPMPARALPVHLRLAFRQLLVRRAMDPSCPADEPGCPAKDESTRLGQISKPPGEWNLYWDVAGIWGLWKPTVVLASDGQAFPGTQTVDFYVPRGKPWRLFALARECDFGALGSFGGQQVPVAPCPGGDELGNLAGDDHPGTLVASFRSPAASLGLHRTNSLVEGSTCPPSNRQGCYRLTYSVTRVGR